MGAQTATFAAGCFWGPEVQFRQVEGVTDAAVGFMGGHTRKPTYRQVCEGDTGHAEVVHLEFDDSRVSYPQLLEVFFSIHDPTTRDRQGPDAGSQYRSVIFTHSEDQERAAREAIAKLEESGRLRGPVVTSVEPAGEFWRAEEYHQRYLEKKGLAACPR